MALKTGLYDGGLEVQWPCRWGREGHLCVCAPSKTPMLITQYTMHNETQFAWLSKRYIQQTTNVVKSPTSRQMSWPSKNLTMSRNSSVCHRVTQQPINAIVTHNQRSTLQLITWQLVTHIIIIVFRMLTTRWWHNPHTTDTILFR